MIHKPEGEQDLGFAEKVQRDIFTIQPNIGQLALDRVMHAEILSPYDRRLSRRERDTAVRAIHPLENTYQTPFSVIRMLIRSSYDEDPTLQESLFITTIDEQGLDIRGDDVASNGLMSVLQYTGLYKATGSSNSDIDKRPPKRELEKPFVQAMDHGDVWTSTVLHHPTRDNAVYTGLVRNGTPVINTITKDRVLKTKSVPKSHAHIDSEHPYRMRPVVSITTRPGPKMKQASRSR